MAEGLSRRGFLVGLGPGIYHLSFGRLPDWGQPILTVAHCADPQLGFCRVDTADRPVTGAYEEDLARAEQAIGAMNRLHVDAAVFCGDMVHVAAQIAEDWPRLLRLLEMPVIVAPGNHDVGIPVDPAKVQTFASVFGADHRVTTVKGWKFVSVNSQYAFPESKGPVQEEHDAWFENELVQGKAKGQPMIVVDHVPPYQNDVDEADSYNNFPRAKRRALLDRMITSGVRFVLSGHLHLTIRHSYGMLPILNPEVTSRSFDSRPLGFRLLKIYSDNRFTWEFVSLGS